MHSVEDVLQALQVEEQGGPMTHQEAPKLADIEDEYTNMV